MFSFKDFVNRIPKVTSFKDFFKSVKTTDTLLSISDSRAAIATKVCKEIAIIKSTNTDVLPISNSDIKSFGEYVSQRVHSDDFLDELSANIGTPKDNESRDEFIDRAKDTMKNLLRAKLFKELGINS